jgi:hypothetical protein
MRSPPATGGGLRDLVVVRHAPAIALLILLGVCVVGLGLVSHGRESVIVVAPLATVLALYVARVRG